MVPAAEDKRDLGVREWTLSKRRVAVPYTISHKSRRSSTQQHELLVTTLPPSTVPVDHEFVVIR
jgi:DNA adenine methylase